MMSAAAEPTSSSKLNKDHRILLVDDEPSLLDGLVRRHRKNFNLTTACGGPEALEIIGSSEPFAVIVSDYRMPRMDGIEFLKAVVTVSPESVRVMLTGNSEYNIALAAVNQGNVFRFLAKPVEEEDFRGALNAAIEQYELRRAEKILLEQTLTGAIAVLSEILALTNPSAFGRATRVKALVEHITASRNEVLDWRIGMAALLSQIGCVTIPESVMERVSRGETLEPAGSRMMHQHPGVAQRLIERIPRLDEVAKIVGYQNRTKSELESAELSSILLDQIRILQTALALDSRLSAGFNLSTSVDQIRKKRTDLGPWLDILAKIDLGNLKPSSVRIHIDDIIVGMILDEDVRNETGAVLVPKGFSITTAVIERLRNHVQLSGLAEDFLIRC